MPMLNNPTPKPGRSNEKGIEMKQTQMINQVKFTRKIVACVQYKSSMSILIFILLVSGFPFICFPQTDDTINIKSSYDVCASDPEEPSYPGGSQELYSFINQNFQDSLIQPGTLGRIFLKITVDTSGSLKVEVLHGINDVLDKEMLRVFSLMPKWIPAEKDGVKVEKTFAMPVRIGSSPEKK